MGLLPTFLQLVTQKLSSAVPKDDEGEIVVFFLSVLIVPKGGEVKIPLPPDDVLIACWLVCDGLRHLLLSRCCNHRHDKGLKFLLRYGL